MRTCIGVAILLSLTAAACATVAPNGPFSLSVATGLQPSRSADDAVRISRAYLDAQTPEAEGPHIPPRITAVFAVRANDARALDGCIPSGGGNQIVWVTKGQGDYLNLRDYPWSHPTGFTNNVCELPGTEGTLVVDDATGVILGVYPESPGYPHPSP